MTATATAERTIVETNGRFCVLEGSVMIASCKSLEKAERVRDQKAREMAKIEAEQRQADRIAAREDDEMVERLERAERGDMPVQYIYQGTDTSNGRNVEHGIMVYSDGTRLHGEW